MKSLPLFLIVAFAFIGCSDNEFPRIHKLDRLRIIEIVTSSPEVSPGDTLTFTPYLSDFNGGGRTLTAQSTGCMDPGISYGSQPTCDNSSTRTVLLAPTTVTTLSAPSYTGVGPTLTVTIPTVALVGRPSYVQYNGLVYLVTFQLTASDGTQAQAFRRVFVSTKTEKNQNPGSPSIQAEGTTLSSLPTAPTQLKSVVAASSSESFLYQKLDGSFSPRTEEIRTSWYVTEGGMEKDNTIGAQENLFIPPSSPVSGRNVIIAVTADGRAGSSISLHQY